MGQFINQKHRAMARFIQIRSQNIKKSKFLEKNRKSRNSNKVYFTQKEEQNNLSKFSISNENSFKSKKSETPMLNKLKTGGKNTSQNLKHHRI
jgi:hypothetical protein